MLEDNLWRTVTTRNLRLPSLARTIASAKMMTLLTIPIWLLLWVELCKELWCRSRIVGNISLSKTWTIQKARRWEEIHHFWMQLQPVERLVKDSTKVTWANSLSMLQKWIDPALASWRCRDAIRLLRGSRLTETLDITVRQLAFITTH